MKRKFTFLLCIFFVFQITGCINSDEKTISKFDEKQYKNACNTPFEPYPETITYTLGKLTGVNNSNILYMRYFHMYLHMAYLNY